MAGFSTCSAPCAAIQPPASPPSRSKTTESARNAAIQWHERAHGIPRGGGVREEVGAVNGKQFLEMLARLPARVWLQAILGLIGFIVLAVLRFAVIAGVAAVILIAILALKARQWLRGLFSSTPAARPPARQGS